MKYVPMKHFAPPNLGFMHYKLLPNSVRTSKVASKQAMVKLKLRMTPLKVTLPGYGPFQTQYWNLNVISMPILGGRRLKLLT